MLLHNVMISQAILEKAIVIYQNWVTYKDPFTCSLHIVNIHGENTIFITVFVIGNLLV